MNRRLIAQLLVLFLVTQFLGLYVGSALIKADVRATIVTENPEDLENSIGLFLYILAFTAVLLVAIVLLKGILLSLLLKAFEAIVVFLTSVLVFAAFIDTLLVMAPAAIVVALRLKYPKHIQLRNFTSTVAVAGAGALLGVSLGVLPVLLFIALLAAYDFVAVFKTKHMVTLAKAITSRDLSFTYALPTPEHRFELGTGDMVVPLTFAVSVLAAYSSIYAFPLSAVPALGVLGASLVGLVWTLDYSSRHIGRPLPALPPQVLCMLVFFGLVKLAGL